MLGVGPRRSHRRGLAPWQVAAPQAGAPANEGPLARAQRRRPGKLGAGIAAVGGTSGVPAGEVIDLLRASAPAFRVKGKPADQAGGMGYATRHGSKHPSRPGRNARNRVQRGACACATTEPARAPPRAVQGWCGHGSALAKGHSLRTAFPSPGAPSVFLPAGPGFIMCSVNLARRKANRVGNLSAD
jgi:hypothetical protein